MWLYQWRNVLISHKRWWKWGHWQAKHFFAGGGGGFEKRWVQNVSIRFRVAQNLVLKRFWDTWTLKVLRNIHAPDDIKSVKFLTTRLVNSTGEQLWQRKTTIKKTIYLWVNLLCINVSNKSARKRAKYAPVIDGIRTGQDKNTEQHCGRTERFKLWFFFFAFVMLDLKRTFMRDRCFCWSHRTLKLFRPCCFRLSHTPNAIDTMHR